MARIRIGTCGVGWRGLDGLAPVLTWTGCAWLQVGWRPDRVNDA